MGPALKNNCYLRGPQVPPKHTVTAALRIQVAVSQAKLSSSPLCASVSSSVNSQDCSKH